jgi:DNA mismatch endonuclease, patch repair protein
MPAASNRAEAKPSRRVGTPRASSDQARLRMENQPQRDTAIELELRSLLHREGLRYRIHQRPIEGLRREADVVFRRARVAVYVDGCFWHGCPKHATWPKANARWWRAKIEANRRRDLDTNRRLREAGWLPVRIWEHEDPRRAAERVVRAVRSHAGRSSSGPALPTWVV